MNQTTLEIGQVGEDFAHKYLSSIGFKILERNWRWRKCEIDLIAFHKDKLVFIEVKTRGRNPIDQGVDISHSQRRRIINAANTYLLKKQWDKFESRFDLVRVRKINKSWSVEHFIGVFEVL